MTIDTTNRELIVYSKMHLAKLVADYNGLHFDNPYDMLQILQDGKPYSLPYMPFGDFVTDGAFGITRFIFTRKKKVYVFNSICEAVDFIIKEGLSTAAPTRIRSSIFNNLDGKTKTSFGGTWVYNKVLIPTEEYKLSVLC